MNYYLIDQCTPNDYAIDGDCCRPHLWIFDDPQDREDFMDDGPELRFLPFDAEEIISIAERVSPDEFEYDVTINLCIPVNHYSQMKARAQAERLLDDPTWRAPLEAICDTSGVRVSID